MVQFQKGRGKPTANQNFPCQDLGLSYQDTLILTLYIKGMKYDKTRKNLGNRPKFCVKQG